MADKHILLTFISTHPFKPSKDIYGNTYYNTLGPSVMQLCKEGIKLNQVIVFTSEETEKKSSLACKAAEGEISPIELFRKFCSELDSSMQVENIRFDETAGFASNVSSIMQAIQKITPEKDIIHIHIDTTPGFRNASMLLTAITQLLRLNPNVSVENIIYYKINYAESTKEITKVDQYDSTEIYNISKLSAGAEAFVKYGSTEVLEDYFQEKKILNLRPLLNAMKDFAEALQICSAKLLPANIENLKQQITTFEGINFNELNEYERLFSVFLEKIKEKYKKLFAKSGERRSMQLLNIIEWCKENNYIQQEITLATELIPVIIYLEKMFYPAPNTLNAVKREYFDKTYGKKGKNINKKDKRWQTLSEDILASFFIKSYKYDLFKPYEDNQSKNRFSEMINNNDAATSLDNQIANEICYKYLKINEVRNKINHAANEKDIKYVKSILTEMIGRLRRLLKKMNYSNKPEKK